MPRRIGGEYDLGSLYTKYGLCDLARSGAIDEVWVWDGGQGGLPEWAVNGPEWSYTAGTRIPNCGRQMTTMVFNNTRMLDVAMESIGHRLETTFRQYFACDLFTETWPWVGWPASCRGKVSDRTGFVARPFQGNDYVGACGDIHHPPNILDDRSYTYGDPLAVQSICEDWQRDGSARARTVSCANWGCSHTGFMVWWMQNVPGYHNANRDAEGHLQPNWWEYLFGAPLYTPTPWPTLTPRATQTPEAPTPTRSPTSSGQQTATPWEQTPTPGSPSTSPPTPGQSATPTPTPGPTRWKVFLPIVFLHFAP